LEGQGRAGWDFTRNTLIPLIEIRDVSKAYPGSGREGVSHLNLTIHRGEFLALIGPSGSGKTTTLNMVNRLVDADSGTIRIEGQDIRETDPVRLRRGIGYVFQEAGLFPHMTVAQNIAVTPRLLGWDEPRIRARVKELLDLVRLDHDVFSERRSQDLSGGQRQRVALARALAVKPHILLLDEPFGALDPVTREAVANDVREIHQTLGLTTLMVTHDMTEALLLADRIAVMREGTLIQVGSARELVHEPADAFVTQLIETPRRSAQALARMLAP
jgi:osmoprotectant transport system ATP-binding protein